MRDLHVSVKNWHKIVDTMITRPETPEAINEEVVLDRPACENRTGAYCHIVRMSIFAEPRRGNKLT